MQEEKDGIEKNKIWELVEKPNAKKVISKKWFYKVKHNPNGSFQKNKATY